MKKTKLPEEIKADDGVKKTKTPEQITKEEKQNATIRRILEKTGKAKGGQLQLTDGGVKSVSLVKYTMPSNKDDPDKKYDLYWRGMHRLMTKHLPSGKENKRARGYIYEEKNVFLTRGKRKNILGRRGADSRMAYLTEMEVAFNTVLQWASRGGSMINLYDDFRKLNIKNNFTVVSTKKE